MTSGGAGQPDGNYLTGFYGSPYGNEWRSFFTFDLSGVSGPISSAQFKVSLAEFGFGPSPVTLNLAAFTGDINALDAGTAGVAGFLGLAPGTLLGTATLDPASNGTLSIVLNPAGLAAIEAAEGGYFAIGGSLIGVPPENFLFAYSLGNPPTELVLNAPVPEPSSMLLFGSGLAAAVRAMRRKVRS